MSTRRGEIRSAASTDEAAERNDQIQQEEAQGPCMDAVWEQLVVQVPDLREERRWPRWASRTLAEGGVLSMLCVRLFTHDDRVGALNLFSSQPHAFGLDDEEEAVAIAAHAAVAVAAVEDIEGLKIAVGSRTVIGQATGMVMVQYGLTDGRAFDVLKRLSSHENRKLLQSPGSWSRTGTPTRNNPERL